MIKPIKVLLQNEDRLAGIVLILATVTAILWANSRFADEYRLLTEVRIGLVAGPWEFGKTLLHWVNDGLMALFFLMVGLEIKHEMSAGSLRRPREAAMTAAAAVGGMLVPALIYIGINVYGGHLVGWGIPVATDIAFVVGLLGMLGKRVAPEVKVFITAVAVVDDIGAVLIIALFYSDDLSLINLAAAIAILAVLFVYGRFKGQRVAVFAILGLIAWWFMLRSGVHATLAGVLLAFTIPLQSEHDPERLTEDVRRWKEDSHPADDGVDGSSKKLKDIAKQAQSPRHRVEEVIRHWVLFLVMPLFALLNAGVAIRDDLQWATPVVIGVSLGLVLGKPLGMLGFIWLAQKFNLGRLPSEIDTPSLVAVSLLAGVGFTMALFISGLAFDGGALLDQAKIGVLAASLLAALAGVGVLLFKKSE